MYRNRLKPKIGDEVRGVGETRKGDLSSPIETTGIVVGIDGEGEDMRLTVAFLFWGVKTGKGKSSMGLEIGREVGPALAFDKIG